MNLISAGPTHPSNPFVALLPPPRIDSLASAAVIALGSSGSTIHVPAVTPTSNVATSQTAPTVSHTPTIVPSTNSNHTAASNSNSAGTAVGATAASPQIQAAVPVGTTVAPGRGGFGGTVAGGSTSSKQGKKGQGGSRSGASAGSSVATRSQDTTLRSGQKLFKDNL